MAVGDVLTKVDADHAAFLPSGVADVLTVVDATHAAFLPPGSGDVLTVVDAAHAAFAPAAPWTPASLPGLQLWLSADVGVYQDAARTTPAVATNDPVGGWADQSGQGHHVSQATAGNRPLLQLAQQNGRPSLLFDGIDDAIGLAALSMADTGFSLFVVGKLLDVGLYPMWVVYGSVAAGDWNLRCAGVTGRPSLVSQGDNMGAGEASTGVPSGTTTNLVGAGFQLIDGHLTPSDGWSIYQQGTLRDTQTVAITLTAPRSLTVGSRPTSAWLPGHEAAVLLYNPVLSAGDAALVRAYLNAAWAMY